MLRKLVLAMLALATLSVGSLAQDNPAEFFARDRSNNWTGKLYTFSNVPRQVEARHGSVISSSKLQNLAYAKQAAREHNIREEEFVALVWQESRFRSSAVSNQGAMGLAQILPSTWRSLGCKGNIMNPLDNARCGAKYFAQGRHVSLEWALRRYHGGPNTRHHGPKTQHYARVIQARIASGNLLRVEPTRVAARPKVRRHPTQYANRRAQYRRYARKPSKVRYVKNYKGRYVRVHSPRSKYVQAKRGGKYYAWTARARNIKS